MNLSFSTKIEGKPTYFIDKIWDGLREHEIFERHERHKYSMKHWDLFGMGWSRNYGDTHYKSKIHTMREDPTDRWKVGSKIHFVINNRSKDRFQFAPVLEVTRIDYIEIEWVSFIELDFPIITISGNLCYQRWHDGTPYKLGRTERQSPGGKKAYFELLDTLAKNDGFECREDFLAYFKNGFKGKLIHWTDYKY